MEGLFPVLIQAVEIGDELLVQLVAAFQVAGIDPPRLGDLDGVLVPVEQLYRELLFQLGNMLAEIGLGYIQLFGRLGDAALAGNGQKIFRVFVYDGHCFLPFPGPGRGDRLSLEACPAPKQGSAASLMTFL